MLFRLVRPMWRKESRYPSFVKRVPADVRERAAGLKLAVPVGEHTQAVAITARTQTIRLSLRTCDPDEVKQRQAQVAGYLTNVFRALREDAPVPLSHEQAHALGGELYRAWANGAGRERTTAVEYDPDART